MTNDYKQCVQCGEIALLETNYCPQCGSSQFQEPPPALTQHLRTPTASSTTTKLRLNAARIIVATTLSAGLYIFYWLYITWKQLDRETTDDHYPVWHALTLFVPIYGWFRLHRHVSLIKDLALAAGIPTTLSAGTAVVLVVVSTALDFITAGIFDPAVAVPLTVISVVVTTTLIVWAQGALNAYWKVRHGEMLTDAPIGIGEVLLVVAGLLLVWVGTFFPE